MPSNAHVLYIDDDAGLRRLVERRMTARGYRVTPAGDGREGLDLAGAASFDLIAIDHYMPGQDGLTTLGQLREVAPETPIVFVTGSDESKIAVAALKAGAYDYVVKSAGDDFFDLLHNSFMQALSQMRLHRAKTEAEQALQDTNRRLEALVERQAALLAEVNHRVANSLQMVSAMVRMQASALGDQAARSALVDAQSRIHAIGQVHRRLYTSDNVETVDLAAYLDGLVRDLSDTCSTPKAQRHVRLLGGDGVLVGTDAAVSIGVIVSELVTNAAKYAYDSDASGEVRVILQTQEGRVTLSVEDDGPGFDPADPPRGTGLGSKVVRAMTANLKGELTLDRAAGGMRTILEFGL